MTPTICRQCAEPMSAKTRSQANPNVCHVCGGSGPFQASNKAGHKFCNNRCVTRYFKGRSDKDY